MAVEKEQDTQFCLLDFRQKSNTGIDSKGVLDDLTIGNFLLSIIFLTRNVVDVLARYAQLIVTMFIIIFFIQ